MGYLLEWGPRNLSNLGRSRQIQEDTSLKDKYNLKMLNKQELGVPGRETSGATARRKQVRSVAFSPWGQDGWRGHLALLG